MRLSAGASPLRILQGVRLDPRVRQYGPGRAQRPSFVFRLFVGCLMRRSEKYARACRNPEESAQTLQEDPQDTFQAGPLQIQYFSTVALDISKVSHHTLGEILFNLYGNLNSSDPQILQISQILQIECKFFRFLRSQEFGAYWLCCFFQSVSRQNL